MTYVMSDLHGMYNSYIAMLELIKFNSEDKLYILGDICDRGKESARIYLDIMVRSNVFCIKGNHEQMLLEALPLSFEWLQVMADQNALCEDSELWYLNGGRKTKRSFYKCNKSDISRIYRFIKQLPLHRRISLNGKCYTLVHAGGYSRKGCHKLRNFSPMELLWDSPDFDSVFGDKEKDVLIVGHMPTVNFNGKRKSKIYCGAGNIIDVDCGAVYTREGGRLGCLCLETMKEYYV